MKVSVCVPVSRVESVPYLMQSILRQTWKDWELIAVGQGNPENPHVKKISQIVQETSATDPRVRYEHIDLAGATRAKNAGIKSASSSIIAEIDDDAEAAPDWLETMVQFFDQHPDFEVFGGSVLKPPKAYRGMAVCPSVIPEETMYDPATMRHPPQGWNWISCNIGVKRTAFEKVGLYDEFLGPGSTFPVADDTDLLLRFESEQVKMASSPRLVVHHTFGYRYGMRAYTKHQYNYSYGNGGLAAKLVLAGDERGRAWLRKSKEDRLLSWLRPFRPDRFFRGFVGWLVFKSAYDRCLREFRVENNLLVPI